MDTGAVASSTTPRKEHLSYTRDLTKGVSGDDVQALQTFLIENGFAISGGATGYFGDQTKAALASFQLKHGINPAQGYFGPRTRELLEAFSI